MAEHAVVTGDLRGDGECDQLFGLRGQCATLIDRLVGALRLLEDVLRRDLPREVRRVGGVGDAFSPALPPAGLFTPCESVL